MQSGAVQTDFWIGGHPMTVIDSPHHAVRVRVIRGVTVTYFAALNVVTVAEHGKVIRSEVAPKGYTAAQFADTVDRVRKWYQN